MTSSVKTPVALPLLRNGHWLRQVTWVNIYDSCNGGPCVSRTDANLMADTWNPPLYRIKITPKVRP